MTPTHYSRDEEREVVRGLREGQAPACPRCGSLMQVQEVLPREEVPYVRTRIWLTCPGCRRSLVLDRRRVQPGP